MEESERVRLFSKTSTLIPTGSKKFDTLMGSSVVTLESNTKCRYPFRESKFLKH